LDENGGQPYKAVALSLVFHPLNPHVPTLRADVRMFQVSLSIMTHLSSTLHFVNGFASLDPIPLRLS
jgi:coproporphyrinogen III oxidase